MDSSLLNSEVNPSYIVSMLIPSLNGVPMMLIVVSASSGTLISAKIDSISTSYPTGG